MGTDGDLLALAEQVVHDGGIPAQGDNGMPLGLDDRLAFVVVIHFFGDDGRGGPGGAPAGRLHLDVPSNVADDLYLIVHLVHGDGLCLTKWRKVGAGWGFIRL